MYKSITLDRVVSQTDVRDHALFVGYQDVRYNAAIINYTHCDVILIAERVPKQCNVKPRLGYIMSENYILTQFNIMKIVVFLYRFIKILYSVIPYVLFIVI